MELIDKATVVAEIERIEYETNYEPFTDEVLGKRNGCRKIREFLDTLEVKEVDFEKELDRIWFDNKLGNYFDNDALDFAHVRTLCKHFFELGLASQLTWQDIRLISELGEEFMNSEESDNCTDDEAYYSVILNKLKQLGRDYKTQRQEIRELNKAQKGE